MACFHPIKGVRGADGRVRFTGQSQLDSDPVTVPCGRCWGCKLERSRQWAMRIVHESTMHERNSFLTLTYRDEDLPEGGSLCLRDWTLFMKRLRQDLAADRKKQRLGPLRFFHCGEYGEIKGRPHLHVCLFGEDFASDRVPLPPQSSSAFTFWESAKLEKLWGKGSCLVGDLEFESAAYVARYCMKKITGDKAVEHYGGRKPEYATMSRNPGIGMGWLEKYGRETYRDDSVVMRGREMKPPKFYDRKWEESFGEVMERVKAERLEKGKKFEWNNTKERLAVREEVAKAAYKLRGKRTL